MAFLSSSCRPLQQCPPSYLDDAFSLLSSVANRQQRAERAPSCCIRRCCCCPHRDVPAPRIGAGCTRRWRCFLCLVMLGFLLPFLLE